MKYSKSGFTPPFPKNCLSIIQGRAGFTLVEIVFALTIFAGGMLIIWELYFLIYANLISIKNLQTATEILQNQIHSIQNGEYYESRHIMEISGKGEFRLVREVRPIRRDIDEIKIEVFWKEKENEKNVFAITYRSKQYK
ncbi:MAG: type II secretion system protein [Elusimicrobiota bacterium]